MNLLYNVLPVLIAAAVLRLLLAERLDFSAVLLGITVVTGLVWVLDALWLGPQRAAAARGVGRRSRAPSPSPARSTTRAASFRWRWWCCCCARSCSSRSASRPTR